MPKPKETFEQKILRQFRQEKPGHMTPEELDELVKTIQSDKTALQVKGLGLVSGEKIQIDTTIGELEAAEMWHVWRRDKFVLGKIADPFAKEKRTPLALD